MTLEQNVADLTAANIKLTNEVLETKAKAAVSADSALLNADRAVAAQGTITDELAQIQALAAQVSADKENVTSTLIGNEDYIVPAVVKLLGSYTGVVDTALSDDVWAEHAYKWGAPSQVLAVGLDDRVELRDMTKPSLPVVAVYSFWSGANPITCVEFCGAALFVGSSNEFVGLHIFDFADGVTHRIKNGAATKESLGAAPSNSSPVSEFPLFGSGMFNINDVAARISDDSPHHPVSGVPMPTIAVGTEGGAPVLVPDGSGSWVVRNSVCIVAIKRVSFDRHGRLYYARGNFGRVGVSEPSEYQNGPFGTAWLNTDADYTPDSVVALRDENQNLPTAGGSQTIYESGGDLTVVHANPSEPSAGMAAYVSADYATPYLPGDVHCALLCDGEEGVVTGGNLVSNPDFSDQSGWQLGAGWSISEGKLIAASVETTEDKAFIDVPVVAGQLLEATLAADAVAEGRVAISYDLTGGLQPSWSSAYSSTGVAGALKRQFKFDTSGVFKLAIRPGVAPLSCEASLFDLNVMTEDRSGRSNPAIINGTLSFSKPPGSDIAVATGFADTGAKQPQNCIRKKLAPGNALVVSMLLKNDSVDAPYDIPFHVVEGWDGTPADPFKTYLKLQNDNAGAIRAIGYRSDQGVLIHTGSVAKEFTPVTVVLTSSVFAFYVNGQIVAEWEGATDFPSEEVEVLIGTGLDSSGSANWNGDIGPVWISGTQPSIDQIRDMHRLMKMQLEKPSFLTGSVRAVAHDPVRNQDWVACSDGQLHRYDGPVIVESVTVPAEVGTINSLTVSDGDIVVGGSADGWSSQEAKNLRALVVKKGKSVRSFELGEGDSVRTDFYLQCGWKPVRAYVDGSKKRRGPQDDWQPKFDGYRWFVRFAVAPGAVDIDCDATEV